MSVTPGSERPARSSAAGERQPASLNRQPYSGSATVARRARRRQPGARRRRTQRTRSSNAVRHLVGENSQWPTARIARCTRRSLAPVGGDVCGVVLLHRERHEQVAEVVQRQHRHARVVPSTSGDRTERLASCGRRGSTGSTRSTTASMFDRRVRRVVGVDVGADATGVERQRPTVVRRRQGRTGSPSTTRTRPRRPGADPPDCSITIGAELLAERVASVRPCHRCRASPGSPARRSGW